MRTSKVYLSRACYSKRVGHHHLCLGETPRQARDWERFTTGKKKKKERRFSVWRLLAWGSGGRLTRSNHPCDCLLACSVSQSYPTLCDPTDCNLPDSSVHGVLQVRILKWVSISSSRRFSQPRDRTPVSCTGR